MIYIKRKVVLIAIIALQFMSVNAVAALCSATTADQLVACVNFLNPNGGGIIDMQGSTITLPSSSGTFTYIDGGHNGLPEITSPISFENGVITKNPADNFRFMRVGQNGTLDLDNVTLEKGNESTAGLGGAIYVADGGIIHNFTDATISDNKTTNGGGAIFIADGGAIDAITTTTFLNNQATAGSGGAIYSQLNTSIGDITESQFTSNMAHVSGGAIYLEATAELVLLNTTTLASNTSATGNGGAIEVFGIINTVSQNTFSLNAATTGSGGAIDFTGGQIEMFMANNTFNKNSAGANGGAFAIDSASTIAALDNNTISGNTAGAEGGGFRICGTIGDMESNIVAQNFVGMQENDIDECTPTPYTTAPSFNLIEI